MEEDLNDFDLLITAIGILIGYELWNNVNNICCKIIDNNDVSDVHKNFLLLAGAYSMLLKKDKQSIIDALETFEMLIKKDIKNILSYSHYMGVINCAIHLKDYTKAKQYFDKLPVNNSIHDLINYSYYPFNIDFKEVYSVFFNEFAKIISSDIMRKQKNNCLRALYLYSPYDMYGLTRFTKKHINDVERYYKINSHNMIVGCALFHMKCELQLHFSAYLTYMAMLYNNLNPTDNHTFASTAIDECSNEVLAKIEADICDKINMNYDMDMSLVTTEIIDPIIMKAWGFHKKDRNYYIIAELARKINSKFYKNSDYLFEIAYSLGMQKNSKAEMVYQLLLEKEPQNCSALNNLGVIYKESGDLQKAKEYFGKAYEITPTDELYIRNLNDVTLHLDKYEKALIKVKKELIWFIGRLNMFYELANENGEIQCTYKERPTILKVRPDKANELVDKMVKYNYIQKISNGDYHTPATYTINPLIKNFLAEQKIKLAKNREYEKIFEKVNIDTIESIGYTDELIELLNYIKDNDFKEILKRDLKECAVCLLAEQNKATIIMCGSIIEALLMNKILEKNIDRYDIGTLFNRGSKIQKVIDMDINKLLLVADKENLIKKEYFHLSHFARSYRNIIHPACEIRKGIEVSSEEATFMWDILLRIMRAIMSE